MPDNADAGPAPAGPTTVEPWIAEPTNVDPLTIEPMTFDPVPDIRLIAVDMDGTLLNPDHSVPEDFWPLVDELHRRGVVFAPASGRQYFTLLEQFAPVADEAIFICENGAYVVRNGAELSSAGLPRADVQAMVRTARRLRAAGADITVILSCKESAYIEPTDSTDLPVMAEFLRRMTVVDDLTAVEDDVLKLAVFDAVDAERVAAPGFAEFAATHSVVATGKHWLDIMSRAANKGAAIRHVQQTLGITRDQTMVFGDFLNDLEMMDEATYSFAMANAHPALAARARYRAPRNTENGVVRTIRSALGLP